ncbi:MULTISPECIES: hypothetical protein [Arthrobacter]|uniref:Restriction endonuclease n=2 Tax=Arthrobacter TaxID=1663 RepID=A0ABU9KLW3_9MICC|nr:hypothetical protein [Arthrobacter sp. YJM1]MDP5227342.1 hypothetical protein [Arthrobacter sp. YJM1]
MIRELTRKPWPELASTAPLLPGGAKKFVPSLVAVLEAISDGPNGLSQTVDPEQVQRQIGVLGFTQRAGDSIELTASGKDWISTSNMHELFLIMHSRLAYFGELLARVATSPATIEDLRRDAKDRYLMSWSSLDQVRRRTSWLQALGLIELWPDHLFRVTTVGTQVLEEIDLADPNDIQAAILESQSSTSLPATPPILAAALEECAPSARSLSWSYMTKNPVETLSLITREALPGATKVQILEQVARHCDISESSAKSAVDSAGLLGLYEFTGKLEVTATPLGREWLDNATELNLVRLLHLRFHAFGEVLQHLSESPRSAGEIHRRLFAHTESGPNQSRTANVLRRLSAAEAVSSIGYSRYIITGVGAALLAELPMADLDPLSSDERQMAESGEPSGQELDALVNELEESSRDSAHPERFEKACAAAFLRLGVDAQHLGGAGRTDVVVTVRSGLQVVARAIVDAKSSAGQLNENSVKFEVLKEHATKHKAGSIAVIAPTFDGSGRLVDWAESSGVVLFTAAELGLLLRSHDEYPFSASEVAKLLEPQGREEVQAEREESFAHLNLFGEVLDELSAEAKQPDPEPISARDIGRAMRRTGASISDDSVAAVLNFLSVPEIMAVQTEPKGTYTLPSSRSVAAMRLRAIAQVIEGKPIGKSEATQLN